MTAKAAPVGQHAGADDRCTPEAATEVALDPVAESGRKYAFVESDILAEIVAIPAGTGL
jgi:hypothetical protein